MFGRDPQPAELSAGVEYLVAEPLRAYEERRAAEDATKKEIEADPKKAPKPKPKPMPGEGMAMEGMMAGVTGPPPGPPDPSKKPLPVTPFGRYVKILLSSSEFLFIE